LCVHIVAAPTGRAHLREHLGWSLKSWTMVLVYKHVRAYISIVPPGFYTPLGILVILGIHVLPLALYTVQHPPFELMLDKYHLLIYSGIGMLAVGRFLCGLVEVSNSSFYVKLLHYPSSSYGLFWSTLDTW